MLLEERKRGYNRSCRRMEGSDWCEELVNQFKPRDYEREYINARVTQRLRADSKRDWVQRQLSLGKSPADAEAEAEAEAEKMFGKLCKVERHIPAENEYTIARWREDWFPKVPRIPPVETWISFEESEAESVKEPVMLGKSVAEAESHAADLTHVSALIPKFRRLEVKSNGAAEADDESTSRISKKPMKKIKRKH